MISQVRIIVDNIFEGKNVTTGYVGNDSISSKEIFIRNSRLFKTESHEKHRKYMRMSIETGVRADHSNLPRISPSTFLIINFLQNASNERWFKSWNRAQGSDGHKERFRKKRRKEDKTKERIRIKGDRGLNVLS